MQIIYSQDSIYEYVDEPDDEQADKCVVILEEGVVVWAKKSPSVRVFSLLVIQMRKAVTITIGKFKN
jgi:hypothetical protein